VVWQLSQLAAVWKWPGSVSYVTDEGGLGADDEECLGADVLQHAAAAAVPAILPAELAVRLVQVISLNAFWWSSSSPIMQQQQQQQSRVQHTITITINSTIF
jgi:hypothetical protein